MPRKAQTRTKPEPVEVFTPNVAAWTTALALAAGDHTRLKALDANTVLIANSSTQRLLSDIKR